MRKIAYILVLLVVVIFPAVSWAGELEDAQEAVRQNPDSAIARYNLGTSYKKSRDYQEAIASYKEAIRINPNFAEAHLPLGLIFGVTKDGFSAIKHTFIAGKLFERQNKSKATALAEKWLQHWFKVFPKYRPEDLAKIQIPIPSPPDDIQLIINSAKGGYLTKELHKKYWDSIRKKGSDENDENFVKLLTEWYPKINRLQLNFNREIFKSLKLTLKNKKITYSSEYEASYQKMKRETFNLPFQKGTTEYINMYKTMIPEFKKSKIATDRLFEYAITGKTMTYPYDRSVKIKINLQTVLAMESMLEEGWKNLLKLFNPTWSE